MSFQNPVPVVLPNSSDSLEFLIDLLSLAIKHFDAAACASPLERSLQASSAARFNQTVWRHFENAHTLEKRLIPDAVTFLAHFAHPVPEPWANDVEDAVERFIDLVSVYEIGWCEVVLMDRRRLDSLTLLRQAEQSLVKLMKRRAQAGASAQLQADSEPQIGGKDALADNGSDSISAPFAQATAFQVANANRLPEPPANGQTDQNVFQLDGKVWKVRYRDGDESGSFADRENSVERRLARLLADPNRRFPALAFYPPPPGVAAIPHIGRDESSDSKALNEVEKRLTRLVNEIKEAEAAHDTESANTLRDEFEKLTEHFDVEKKARKRGHKKRCGALSPAEKADQALRVGLERLRNRFRENGLPKLADHFDKCINNSEGEWWYAPSPGTSQWNVTFPSATFQK